MAGADDAESDAPGFDDTDIDLTEVEEALGTSPEVPAKSTPKSRQPLEFDESNLYVDEPPKPSKATLSATATMVLQEMMPRVRQRGSAHPSLEQADGTAWFNGDFVDHCKAEAAVAVPGTSKLMMTPIPSWSSHLFRRTPSSPAPRAREVVERLDVHRPLRRRQLLIHSPHPHPPPIRVLQHKAGTRPPPADPPRTRQADASAAGLFPANPTSR
ncbi:MAG: hypothetical protein JWM54_2165 [Acidobacteriaceae bacterium]|nr:hypothetical protein [Acidobacteriaceae bacterium]